MQSFCIPVRWLAGFLVLTTLSISGCSSDNGDERSSFLGRYEVEEYSQVTYSQRPEYEVIIRADQGTEDFVIISNFYNMDFDAGARVDGQRLIIPSQVYNFYEVEGEGELRGSVITLHYTVSSVLEEGDFFDRLSAELNIID
ncbi:MAG: hypothetical protein ACLFN2_05495 [Bacteroidales bacterium]